jgi:hypothetical protein
LAWVVPFQTSLSFAIGAVLAWGWTRLHKRTADVYVYPIAAGFHRWRVYRAGPYGHGRYGRATHQIAGVHFSKTGNHMDNIIVNMFRKRTPAVRGRQPGPPWKAAGHAAVEEGGVPISSSTGAQVCLLPCAQHSRK